MATVIPDYKKDFDLSSLIPYARNSRTHSDAQVAQIAASIKEFGFTNPVLIDEQVKNESDLWEIKKDHNYVHPTQKPVALSVRAFSNHIKLTNVLDLFGGSGSTLIGAEQTGRKAYLMELDPKYVDVIIKRWQDFTGKQATHEETGKTYAEMVDEKAV